MSLAFYIFINISFASYAMASDKNFIESPTLCKINPQNCIHFDTIEAQFKAIFTSPDAYKNKSLSELSNSLIRARQLGPKQTELFIHRMIEFLMYQENMDFFLIKDLLAQSNIDLNNTLNDGNSFFCKALIQVKDTYLLESKDEKTSEISSALDLLKLDSILSDLALRRPTMCNGQNVEKLIQQQQLQNTPNANYEILSSKIKAINGPSKEWFVDLDNLSVYISYSSNQNCNKSDLNLLVERNLKYVISRYLSIDKKQFYQAQFITGYNDCLNSLSYNLTPKL